MPPLDDRPRALAVDGRPERPPSDDDGVRVANGEDTILVDPLARAKSKPRY